MRTPGGPSIARVHDMLRTLASRFAVAGFSIVEYVHGGDASLAVLGDIVRLVVPERASTERS
jgi:arginase family enzyme